jgi:hypothetical protein
MTGGTSGDDILEQDSRRFRLPGWRPSRGAGVLAVVALAVGLAAGYAAGTQHPHGGAVPRPTVTVTASPSGSLAAVPVQSFSYADSSALIQDQGSCAAQTGHELQLGIQFTNESPQPVTLTTARVVLPLGGLTEVTHQWGPCGALAGWPSQGAGLIMLLPGESTWLSATLKVQAGCPWPLPVQFSVGYQAQGHSYTASLAGFPDLGQVPYSGCPPVPSGSAVQEFAELPRPDQSSTPTTRQFRRQYPWNGVIQRTPRSRSRRPADRATAASLGAPAAACES